MANKRKWLRWAGFTIGLAGMALIMVLGLFNYEGGPSWQAVPPLMIIYVTPFLICVLVALKWPLVGSIALVAVALFWLVFDVIIVFSNPIAQPVLPSLLAEFELIAPLTLPPLVAGILFLLYWKAERVYLVRGKS